MKKIYAIGGLALLSIFSCTRTAMTNSECQDVVPVNFTWSIEEATKADGSSFEEGDRIGMYAFRHSPDAEEAFMGVRQVENKMYEMKDGRMAADAPVYFPKYEDNTDFYLYFPWTDRTIEPNSVYIPLIAYDDQSDDKSFNQSDRMIAKVLDVKKSGAPIHFTFKRVMSKLSFRIKPGSGYSKLVDIESAEVLVKNICNEGALNCITMQLDGVATNKDVVPHGRFSPSSDRTLLEGVEAIIPPQSFTKGKVLFYVMIGDKKYKGVLSEDLTLEASKNYTFTMTVNRSVTGDDVLISPEIEPWKEGGTTEGGVIEVDPEEDINWVTDYDGNEYSIVRIGGQKWFGQNLMTTHLNDGTPIDNPTGQTDWDNMEYSEKPAWCWYDNDPELGKKYGALYNWHAAHSPKICPEGWHVPTVEEWNELINYLGDGGGTKLKAKEGWHDVDGVTKPEYQGTDDYGFTALPTGNRRYQTGFDRIDMYGEWWSATAHENTSSSAYLFYVYARYSDVKSIYHLKETGHGIRCLKD